ncbi:DUF1330 domain-containing protein [Pseudomonas sp. CrR14]|nr:DUF1330 domain-containing protein [Pseudomonas sp. CrR14]
MFFQNEHQHRRPASPSRGGRARALTLASLACLTLASIQVSAKAPTTQDESAPAYYVAEFEATDPDGIKPYSAQVEKTFTPFGGSFVIRGGVLDVKEGFGAQGRLVAIRFPSLAQAQAWYESPSYQAIIPIRHRSGNTRTYIVEGLPGSK